MRFEMSVADDYVRFWRACISGNPLEVTRIFDKDPKYKYLYYSEHDHNPPLTMACMRGSLEIVKCIMRLRIERGVQLDINRTNTRQETCLMISAACGHKEIVELLLQQGDVDINFISQSKTILGHLCSKSMDNYFRKDLYPDTRKLEMIEMILNDPRTDVNKFKKYTCPPLMETILVDWVDAFKLMLDWKIKGKEALGDPLDELSRSFRVLKVTVRTKSYDYEPLAFAVEYRALEIIKFVLENHKKYGFKLDKSVKNYSSQERNHTPLTIAIEKNDFGTINQLITHPNFNISHSLSLGYFHNPITYFVGMQNKDMLKKVLASSAAAPNVSLLCRWQTEISLVNSAKTMHTGCLEILLKHPKIQVWLSQQHFINRSPIEDPLLISVFRSLITQEKWSDAGIEPICKILGSFLTCKNLVEADSWNSITWNVKHIIERDMWEIDKCVEEIGSEIVKNRLRKLFIELVLWMRDYKCKASRHSELKQVAYDTVNRSTREDLLNIALMIKIHPWRIEMIESRKQQELPKLLCECTPNEADQNMYKLISTDELVRNRMSMNLYSIILLLGENILSVSPETRAISKKFNRRRMQDTIRFYDISTALPLELKMLICNLVYGSPLHFIKTPNIRNCIDCVLSFF